MEFYGKLMRLRDKSPASIQPIVIINDEDVQETAVGISQPCIHPYSFCEIVVLQVTQNLKIGRKKQVDSSSS